MQKNFTNRFKSCLLNLENSFFSKVNMRAYFFCFSLLCVTRVGFSADTAVPKDLIASLLPENPTVIEAGANQGEDTIWMSQLWKNGLILAFEPAPFSFPLVEKLARENSNIHAFQLALTKEKGELPFYLAGGASSLLFPEDGFNRDYFHIDPKDAIIVQSISLDEWLEKESIPKVDFLWLDMEGNELNALKGAQKYLDEVTLIYTEVNIQRFWKGCVLYEELKEWLEEQGFTEIWSEINPNWQGNALFLNKRKSNN